MTHDKVRQDFEKFCADIYGFDPDPKNDTDEFGFAAYQAGRAAERAEIREKLESFRLGDVVRVVGKYAVDFKDCDLTIVGMNIVNGEVEYTTKLDGEGLTDRWKAADFALVHRKAAITKILEVI